MFTIVFLRRTENLIYLSFKPQEETESGVGNTFTKRQLVLLDIYNSYYIHVK